MDETRAPRSRPGWPLVCIGLLGLALVGILGSLAGLPQLGVDGSFALSALSLLALMVGVAGLQWWALLDALRRDVPWERRMLHVGLILLLVPAGALVYYWLRGHPRSSSPASPPD